MISTIACVPVSGAGPEGAGPAPGRNLLLVVAPRVGGVRGREPGGRLLPALVSDHHVNPTTSYSRILLV